MLVILKMRNAHPGEPVLVENGESVPAIAPEIDDWIIAVDVYDARRQAEAIGDRRLAQWLYGMDSPWLGRHELNSGWVGESRYIMLVS